MPTVTVASLMGKASIILKDDDQTRWPTTELLGWINDGQREIVLYKPNACTKNISVPTVAGTKQTLPTDGVQLVDISRNMGASPGTTPGRAIRLTYREILDVREPDWHTKTPSAVVQHFTYNPLDPKTYYVYPPQPATGMGYVDMVYAAIPDDCVIGTEPLAKNPNSQTPPGPRSIREPIWRRWAARPRQKPARTRIRTPRRDRPYKARGPLCR